MDFINNQDFITAGAAVVGFLLGAGLMWAWRKWREPQELKYLQNGLTESIKQKRAYADTITRQEGEIDSLTKKVLQLEQLPDIADKLKQNKEAEATLQNTINEIASARKIKAELNNGNLETAQKLLDEHAKTMKAKGRKQTQQQTQEADDTISDFEEESKNISTKPPKNTR